MNVINGNDYMENAQGHMVPLEQVREIDRERHALVMEKVEKARAMRDALRDLKREIMGDVSAFVELSAERYEAKVGGDKGNVTLQSFDGRYQIKRQISEHLAFDEGLQAAKALIDECLDEWSKDTGPLRIIVEHAFSVNKEGRIDTNAILSLRRHDIKDERWQRAMQAIGDSLQVLDTRAYVRVYERNAAGKYVAISLNIAEL